MIVELQKIARRDEDFLSNQCKEIGKTIDWGRLAILEHNKGQKRQGPKRSRGD